MPSRGFTLVETLIAVALVAILAAFLLPALSQARQTQDRTVCASNLRQIGTAVAAYAADHDGTLPGPLLGGQQGFWGGSVPSWGYSLIWYLSTYLGLPQNNPPTVPPIIGPAVVVPLFVCPGWRHAMPASAVIPANRFYYVQGAVVLPSGATGSPWGYPSAVAPAPMKWAALRSPSKMWGIVDGDQGTAPGASNPLPPKPVHGTARNYLFFDWHVEARSDGPPVGGIFP